MNNHTINKITIPPYRELAVVPTPNTSLVVGSPEWTLANQRSNVESELGLFGRIRAWFWIRKFRKQLQNFYNFDNDYLTLSFGAYGVSTSVRFAVIRHYAMLGWIITDRKVEEYVFHSGINWVEARHWFCTRGIYSYDIEKFRFYTPDHARASRELERVERARNRNLPETNWKTSKNGTTFV